MSTSTEFDDLHDYTAMPRVSGLVLSPDGSQLVVAVATPDAKNTKYVTAQWRLDPQGRRPAHRLTRGATGESSATFTSDGDLLFTAARPDPQDPAPEGEPVPLWCLPAAGGEASVVAQRRGGFGAVRAARTSPTVVVGASVLPGADLAADDDLRRARADAKVSAILHDGYPIRFWDGDLGPAQPHLARLERPSGVAPADAPRERAVLVDLTPDAGSGLLQTGADLSADGSFLVTSWQRPLGRGDRRSELVLIDVATGARRLLLSDPGADLDNPVVSPDGTWVFHLRESRSTPEQAPRVTAHLVSTDGSRHLDLARGWDRWISSAAWLPDSSGLLVTADSDGRGPVFRLGLDGSAPEQLTDDDFAYTDLRPAPDGPWCYALRSSYAAPPHAVRIELADGAVTALPGPVALPTLPGRLEEIVTTAPDGVRVRAWLALPHGADDRDRAPLVLWVHGGPLGSWNAWSWRWNPWLLAAQGYAVLLPDPALSTGYGQDFIQRGWGAWGGAPYTDLVAATDAAEQHPAIDETRTAAMGGSFGGYMANWIAGHTDRFAAIVTHASLWALDQFGPTTDVATYWAREMTPQMALDNSPHRFVENITTPMLVVHGDKDYRVPIGEGLRLWYELLSASGLPADEEGRSPHRFLYFPSENHWVLTPQHSELWYRVVLDFLNEHVLGEPTAPLPALLGGPAPDELTVES